MTEEQVRNLIIEILNEIGKSIELQTDVAVVTDVDTIANSLSLPAVVYGQDEKPESYVQIPWTALASKLQSIEETLSLAGTQLGQMQEKTAAADTAATNASNMAADASRVNATLNGTVITVTDRNGNSTSKNLSINWNTLTPAEQEAIINALQDALSEEIGLATEAEVRGIVTNYHN